MKNETLILLSGLLDTRHQAADVMNSARKLSAAVSLPTDSVKTKHKREADCRDSFRKEKADGVESAVYYETT